MQKHLTISEAAEYLGVSGQTLRRWDASGQLKASFVSAGGHRRYSLADLEKLVKGLYRMAAEWSGVVEPSLPQDDYYCATSDVFKARLEKFALLMEKDEHLKNLTALVVAVVGEIGNNSFDHNAGNWPDVMGCFFGYDLGKRLILIADRGRGVLTTLRSVRPALKNDKEALTMAFTEMATGRAPEHRGNGLKFVRSAVTRLGLRLKFRSGTAELEIVRGEEDLRIRQSDEPVRGILAMIEF